MLSIVLLPLQLFFYVAACCYTYLLFVICRKLEQKIALEDGPIMIFEYSNECCEVFWLRWITFLTVTNRLSQ